MVFVREDARRFFALGCGSAGRSTFKRLIGRTKEFAKGPEKQCEDPCAYLLVL